MELTYKRFQKYTNINLDLIFKSCDKFIYNDFTFSGLFDFDSSDIYELFNEECPYKIKFQLKVTIENGKCVFYPIIIIESDKKELEFLKNIKEQIIFKVGNLRFFLDTKGYEYDENLFYFRIKKYISRNDFDLIKSFCISNDNSYFYNWCFPPLLESDLDKVNLNPLDKCENKFNMEEFLISIDAKNNIKSFICLIEKSGVLPYIGTKKDSFSLITK